MTLQNFWTDRATDFTQTAKLARLKYPELDYNVKRSHYNGTVEARLTEEKRSGVRLSARWHSVMACSSSTGQQCRRQPDGRGDSGFL